MDYKTMEALLMDDGFMSWYHQNDKDLVSKWNEWIAASEENRLLAEKAAAYIRSAQAAGETAGEPSGNAPATWGRIQAAIHGQKKAMAKAIEVSAVSSASSASSVSAAVREAVRRPVATPLFGDLLFRNYLKVAFRNLTNNKVYSFINIAGLAAGMAVALLIGLWIRDEVSFDRSFPNHARLAQVLSNQTWNGETYTEREVDIPLEAELRSRYGADFRHMALSSGLIDHLVAAPSQDKKVNRRGMWTGAELPGMLGLRMLEGDRDALKDPSSVLLTASLAKALFGDTDPIDKMVMIDSKTELRVGGVFEDLPFNTTYRSSFFASWDKYADISPWIKHTQTQWGNHFCALFVELASPADFDKETAKIRYIPREHTKHGNEEILLHPMDKWHLYNQFHNGKLTGGRIQFVWLFGIVGAFVLLLACINFMNLSTARSERRAKEVGIRKTLGSLRGQLIGQFLSESLLMAFLGLVLALLLTKLSLPFFSTLAAKQLSLPWDQPVFWLCVFGFTLFTGLISGSYPAFYLSSFEPIRVLKGLFRAGRFATLPRKVLVVVQFTASVTLIIGTLVVFRQIQFAKDRPVGYSRERLLSVTIQDDSALKALNYNVLRSELLGTGVVEAMAESSGSETGIWHVESGPDWPGKDPNANPQFGSIAVTHDFGKAIGWQMLEGRDFSRDYRNDSSAFILNESAVRLMGLQHPVGQTLRWQGHDHTVTGVVKDMVMESPYLPAEPTFFYIDYTWNNYVAISIRKEASIQDALTRIGNVFKKHDPNGGFSYIFEDDEYAEKFATEERIGHLATFFAALAIFISCLGLFGLASFVAEQRTKEIGIRKVLGASVVSLWGLLSREFIALVLLSFVIAVPISWSYLSRWLQGYAYHTRISWQVFAGAGTGVLLVTLLIVSYQTIRAASLNPVKSLRTE